MNEWNQKTHKYLTTEKPNIFIWKKKINPEIPIYHSTKKKKVNENSHFSSPPQNCPAMHPKVDL